MKTWISLLSFLTLSTALADEVPTSIGGTEPSQPARPSSPVAEDASVSAPTNKKKKRAPRVEQKENEGTQAKNRFEADTILKSEYHVNGQPLEVDPD